MNTAIPEEIIFFEILKRLPVKSLCRFRAVSKRWLSIITSRPFIDSHFEISQLNPTRLFEITSHPFETNTPTFFSTNNPQTSHKLLWDRYYRYCSISPLGLICFYSGLRDMDTIQIWNPSTGERIEVNPKPPSKLQRRSAYILGFDPVSKNHKLLSPNFIDSEYYLLTLGEKNWRKIITTDDDDGSSRNLTFTNEHCLIDGTLYYLAWSRDQNAYTNLMAFDFGSERFLETIRLPENSVKFNNAGSVRIGVYWGKIVFLHSNWPCCTVGFETWVLEDAKKQKWRIIPPPPPLPPPSSHIHYKLGVIDGEELLIFSSFEDVYSERFRVCRYDLEKDRWSETPFPDFRVEELDGSAVRLYSYVDSLESLARVKGI